jgi:hypothetical protein
MTYQQFTVTQLNSSRVTDLFWSVPGPGIIRFESQSDAERYAKAHPSKTETLWPGAQEPGTIPAGTGYVELRVKVEYEEGGAQESPILRYEVKRERSVPDPAAPPTSPDRLIEWVLKNVPRFRNMPDGRDAVRGYLYHQLWLTADSWWRQQKALRAGGLALQHEVTKRVVLPKPIPPEGTPEHEAWLDTPFTSPEDAQAAMHHFLAPHRIEEIKGNVRTLQRALTDDPEPWHERFAPGLKVRRNFGEPTWPDVTVCERPEQFGGDAHYDDHVFYVADQFDGPAALQRGWAMVHNVGSLVPVEG